MAQERIEKLREKKKAIANQIRREENKLNAQKRKDDTRRKILAGACVLDKASREKQYAEWLNTQLAGFLTRDDDRTLFGLPPLAPTSVDSEGGKR